MDDNNIPSPSADVTELNNRRNIIKGLYQEVLGRDADINGLSYYTVHKEISENDIRKQMVQSTDHRDIVIKAQKYPEIEKKCIDLEDQVIRLQNSNIEKDALIASLRNVTTNMSTVPKNVEYAYDMMTNTTTTPDKSTVNSMISITELKFPKRRGCFGIIRSIFGM